MFRKEKHPKEIMDFNLELAKSYLNEGTKSSIIAAYRILKTLVDNYPDKAFKNYYADCKIKLKEMGLLEEVMNEKKSENTSPRNANLIMNPTRSKL